MATANPERGEVELTVGDETYVLVLTTNGICALEKSLGKTFGEIVMQVAKLDHETLRAVIFHALQRHHQKQFPKIEAVGDLIDHAGGFGDVIPSYRELIGLNKSEKDSAEGDSANPPDAQAGTGPSLRLTRKRTASVKTASGA